MENTHGDIVAIEPRDGVWQPGAAHVDWDPVLGGFPPHPRLILIYATDRVEVHPLSALMGIRP